MPDDKWVSKANLQTFWQMIRSKVLPTMIGDTVTTWLTEHVDPVGSAVVVDDTLTIQGAAADAKKTGDEISGLQEDLASLNNLEKNKHYLTDFQNGYRHGRPNGSLVYSSVWCCTTLPVTFNVGDTLQAIDVDNWEFGLVDSIPENNGATLIVPRRDPYVFTTEMTGYVELRKRSHENMTPAEANNNIMSYMGSSELIDTVISINNIVNKITKYVSPDGNDNNDGNTPSAAYSSIGKALLGGADVIYVANGTYSESIDATALYKAYLYKGVKIICDNATYIPPANGIHFRFTNIDISGLTIDMTDASNTSSYGLFMLNCTGNITDCKVVGAKGAGGFRLDGSKITLTRCIAQDCTIDGFNGHTITTGYETECSFIDCKAFNCGDDGLSIHERGTMFVEGGEYYNNGSTGIAPHQSCKATIRNAYIHDNGHSGLELFNPSTASGYEVVNAMSYGNLYKSNGEYGLNTQYYNVISVNDKFADNTSGSHNQGTGATLEVY